jgi:competence protein ComEA
MSACHKKSDLNEQLSKSNPNNPSSKNSDSNLNDPNNNDNSKNATDNSTDIKDDKSASSDVTEKDVPIYIHVSGHVTSPGVYSLPNSSRVFEAIEMAGGLLDTAAGDAINQAALLTDGQKLYIPSMTEWEDAKSKGLTSFEGNNSANENENTPSSNGVTSANLININTADSNALITLNGIGESRANDIITYRTEHGNFKSIEDIKNVTGIKDGVYNKIKDKITV